MTGAADHRPTDSAGGRCPVCGSAICAKMTRAASVRWSAARALRARFFVNPDRFTGLDVDPGTICQTTRRPIPAVPASDPEPAVPLAPERRPQRARR